MLPTETWLPVAGWEGFYSVSNLGRVRSEERTIVHAIGRTQFVRERILRAATKRSGHQSVCFCRGAEQRRMHVHRLVALAFIGPAPSALHEVAHNDGDPRHNYMSNLRWATRSENHMDKVAHGTHNRGERHPRCTIPDEVVRQVRAATGLCKTIGAKFNIHPGYVWAIRAGLTRKFV